jgi:hypothetical protein
MQRCVVGLHLALYLCAILPLCTTSVPTSCAVDVGFGHFLLSLQPGTMLNFAQLRPKNVYIFDFVLDQLLQFRSFRAVLSGTVHGNDLIC